MRALVATNYCQPEQLSVQDVPVPRAGEGQILVRMAAATINATDIRVITNAFGSMVAVEFPYILGNDFAGTVTEIGSGVTQYRPGDEVFGQALPRQLRMLVSSVRPSLGTGALAEYAVFEADTPLVARRPPSVSAAQAAGLGIRGMTAHAVVKVVAVEPGERVLVIGATGGVGTTTIAPMAHAGAVVIATADTERGKQTLHRLGATTVIGRDPSQFPQGVDVVLNFCLPAQDIGPAAAALRKGGRLVSIIHPPPTPAQLGRDDVAFDVIDWNADYGGMAAVADAAERGELVAVIDRVYPLEQAAQAAVDFARGAKVGQVVVVM